MGHAGSVAASFLAACALLCPPAPQALGAQRHPPVLRTRSNLVLVPVSPLDKHGQVIRGLKPEDFRLLVDGKPVVTSSFDVVAGPATEAPGSPSRISTGEATPPESPVFNIPAESSSTGNLVIFLVDFLNTKQADRMVMRKECLKFFAGQLRANQEIAVYGLTNSLELIQPFTRDPSRLIAAARTLLLQNDMPPEPVESRPLGPDEMDILTVLRRRYNIDQHYRASRTLMAFRQLAGAFSRVPGRKSLLWLTGDASPLAPALLYQMLLEPSLESTGTPFWDIMKTYDAMSAANISVFPVDVRGEFNVGLGNIAEGQSHTEFTQTLHGTQPGDGSSYSNMTDFRQGETGRALQAMQEVAAETGGEVLAGSNDLAGLLNHAQGLWTYYYVLGFDPGRVSSGKQLKYHRIEVKVRTHTTKILARQGYFIRPAALLTSQDEIQRDISEASRSPLDLTSLPLALTLGATTTNGDKRQIAFTLQVRGDGIEIAQDATGAHYDLSVAALTRDPSGGLIWSSMDRSGAVVSAQRAAELKQKGVTFKGEFQAKSGARCSGRVIVRDNLTGRVGTVTVGLPQ
jgi:VWFA-related protein